MNLPNKQSLFSLDALTNHSNTGSISGNDTVPATAVNFVSNYSPYSIAPHISLNSDHFSRNSHAYPALHNTVAPGQKMDMPGALLGPVKHV